MEDTLKPLDKETVVNVIGFTGVLHNQPACTEAEESAGGNVCVMQNHFLFMEVLCV